MASSARRSVPPAVKRMLKIGGILFIAWFAIEGGEYRTSDLVRQRLRHERLTAEVDSLEKVVDSLATFRKRIATDRRLQERIAREEFGMVREKEILYRFAEPIEDETR